MRVGLLAYGAIGHEHNLAVQATEGLELTAVCDVNPERVAAALELAPQAQPFTDATAMIDSGLIDVVIVSTPPNTHHEWAVAALTRDLHVVLEKPMALTTDECDEAMALAAERGRTLVVYQNRRFDADFVTMRRLIREGVIGDVFHYDSFVGGYSRPCDYWHSDVAVSGGAIFDWGSHYIDQILDVLPGTVAHVSGVNHKRHWSHVTNADHATVTITFTDGTQAVFTNSDLSAARRPKYLVLGTLGAIVGEWDPAAEPAVADLPALLTLHRPDGTREPVPLDPVDRYAFHRQLAAHLASGAEMEVSARQSRNVVAIMEAAEASASQLGRPIDVDLRG